LKTERESSICPKALGFVWIYGGEEEARGRGINPLIISIEGLNHDISNQAWLV